MIKLFEDRGLDSQVSEKVLSENASYYLKLDRHDPARIKEEVESSRLASLYEWHPQNPIGKLTLRNVVGTVFIFGEQFDVRSRKFLPAASGENQYQLILKDLSDLSEGIVFNNVSESTFAYEHGIRATSNIFFKFNYLKSLFFEVPAHQRPTYFFQIITHNPHFKQGQKSRNVDIQKLKKITAQTIQRFITQPQYLQAIPKGHHFSEYTLTKFLSGAPGDQQLFPIKAYSSMPESTLDTNENRFVKFFFEDAEAISLYVKNNYQKYSHLPKIADKIIHQSRKILKNNFFKNVGLASTVILSGCSTILNNRSGYKDIYQSYLRSRIFPKSFFDFVENHLDFLDVKNIATLYEYWVFIYLCKKLIPGDSEFRYLKDVISEDGIKPSGSIKTGDITVSYNKSFTNRSCQSYALNFRPDITVEIKKGEYIKRYIFDAKYRNRELTFNNESYDDNCAIHKNEDIAKMLAYVESINHVDAAFIIYPGDQFIYYNKQFSSNNTIRSVDSLSCFSGVGALPLSPGNITSINIFDAFVEKFKDYIASI